MDRAGMSYQAPSSLSLALAVRQHHTPAVLYEMATALEEAHKRIAVLEGQLAEMNERLSTHVRDKFGAHL
jgi:hypothetical protein